MTTSTNTVASELLERNRGRIARAESELRRIREAAPPFSGSNVLRPYNEIGIEVSGAASECGLMAEVHPDPDKALCDGAQSLLPEQFEGLMKELQLIASAVGRTL